VGPVGQPHTQTMPGLFLFNIYDIDIDIDAKIPSLVEHFKDKFLRIVRPPILGQTIDWSISSIYRIPHHPPMLVVARFKNGKSLQENVLVCK